MITYRFGCYARAAAGGAIWLAGWLAILSSQTLSHGSHALMLVLTCVLACLVWRPLAVIIASALSVAAFDWLLVFPRGRFAVDMREDAVLLFTMLSVTAIIALLLGRLKDIAARALLHAERAEQQRGFAEALRRESDTALMVAMLRASLTGLFKSECVIRFGHGAQALDYGDATPNDSAALALCARESRELGAGTARYSGFPGWLLPLGHGEMACGAVLVRLAHAGIAASARDHARALVTLFVTVVERHRAQEAAVQARADEQTQQERNALLASIAHDHRTPLATMLGAASSLAEQHDRLDPARRTELARTIVLEIEHLTRLTDNTLRLAQLESPHVAIKHDWQSAEELVGTVVQRARRRYPGARFQVRVGHELPLFLADAVLMDQLLDNLVDNAVKYGGNDDTFAPIEVNALASEGRMVFEVADRGPGVAAELVAHLFEPFRSGARSLGPNRGMGLGLTICQAIARAHHDGAIAYLARADGGALFRVSLPLPAAPPLPLTIE